MFFPMKRIFASALVTMLVIGCAVSAYAQDKVVKKIIETGTTDNRAMVHIDHLANRIGGRPIGSAALTEAEAWAKEQFESWGLEVMVQEAGEINVGDDILIIGPSTGCVELKVSEIRVDLKPVRKAVKGDLCSIPVAEKLRRSDKLYLWQTA